FGNSVRRMGVSPLHTRSYWISHNMTERSTPGAHAGADTSLRDPAVHPRQQRGAGPQTGFVNRPLVALILLSMLALALAYQVPIVVDLSQQGLVMNGFYDLEGRSSPRPYHWT